MDVLGLIIIILLIILFLEKVNGCFEDIDLKDFSRKRKKSLTFLTIFYIS